MPTPPRRVKRPGRLVSTRVAAAYAEVCTHTLYRWIADGRITGYRAGPKLIKIDLDELDRTVQPIPVAPNGAA